MTKITNCNDRCKSNAVAINKIKNFKLIIIFYFYNIDHTFNKRKINFFKNQFYFTVRK